MGSPEVLAACSAGLPWNPGNPPLMLAPMQGLTNRALRGLFIELVRPDVVFTEFVRVKASTRKNITENDRREMAAADGGVPLVVQLIGTDLAALLAAAGSAQELGACHLNLNLGCPYGRMTGNTAGGALLRDPASLAQMLAALRKAISGSFSLKLRAGFDHPEEIFPLLGLFADCGIDFLILHPRTVKQCYAGAADHRITAGVVEKTSLPVIANGDIFTAAKGREVLAETGAAGLMLGRGAIADPFLFARLRGSHRVESSPAEKKDELRHYIGKLLERYRLLFCGDQQVLVKLKEVFCQIRDPDLLPLARELKRSKRLNDLLGLLDFPEPD